MKENHKITRAEWAHMEAREIRERVEVLRNRKEQRIDLDAMEKQAQVMDLLGSMYEVTPEALHIIMDTCEINREMMGYTAIACEKAGLDSETAEAVLMGMVEALDMYRAAEVTAESGQAMQRMKAKAERKA